MISALDVILIYDDFIRPPGPKLVVCIEPTLGFFFRINTKSWGYSVQILARDHSFLHHDSYIECGDPLEFDDYVIDDAIRRKGVLGRVDDGLRQAIWERVKLAKTVSEADKQKVRMSLKIDEDD